MSAKQTEILEDGNRPTKCNVAFEQAGFQQALSYRQWTPDWMVAIRKEGWDAFQKMQWPSRREEQWMRTDIRMFRLDQFKTFDAELYSEDDLPDSQLGNGVELSGRTAAIDGQNVVSEFSEQWREKGVFFGTIKQAAQEIPEVLKKHLFRSGSQVIEDRFSALHQAMFTGGTVLYVPRNVHLSDPVHIQNVLTEGGSDLAHLLIVLEEGASATVLNEQNNVAVDSSGVHVGAMEITVADRANLSFVSLQDWGSKTWHFARQCATVGADANLQWTVGALGGKLAKVNQHVELVGRGAQCQVNGTMFTQEKQHLSYHTLQHHRASDTRSDFLYKTALQDDSHTVWRGMIKVDKVAQKTDGYQRNDNLLLSNVCRADSIPGLEIEADDVRCTHGSTSGRVDDEQIFYCQNRGFTRGEAIRMIVTGFFQKIFDRIQLESVRDALGLAIARRVRNYE